MVKMIKFKVTLIFLFILVGCVNREYSEESNCSNMEVWLGGYRFFEFTDETIGSPHFRTILINIHCEEGVLTANISQDGRMVFGRARALVVGDNNQIDLFLLEYVQELRIGFWDAEENDILLSFVRIEDEIYTYWGFIQPILNTSPESGEVAFERLDEDQEWMLHEAWFPEEIEE